MSTVHTPSGCYKIYLDTLSRPIRPSRLSFRRSSVLRFQARISRECTCDWVLLPSIWTKTGCCYFTLGDFVRYVQDTPVMTCRELIAYVYDSKSLFGSTYSTRSDRLEKHNADNNNNWLLCIVFEKTIAMSRDIVKHSRHFHSTGKHTGGRWVIIIIIRNIIKRCTTISLRENRPRPWLVKSKFDRLRPYHSSSYSSLVVITLSSATRTGVTEKRLPPRWCEVCFESRRGVCEINDVADTFFSR